MVSQAEVAGGAAVRMDQTRAGVSALQLAGPQESARRVAIGLRGVKSEKNCDPDHRLMATGKALKRCSKEENKSIRRFRSRCTPKASQLAFRNRSAGQTHSRRPARLRIATQALKPVLLKVVIFRRLDTGNHAAP